MLASRRRPGTPCAIRRAGGVNRGTMPVMNLRHDLWLAGLMDGAVWRAVRNVTCINEGSRGCIGERISIM